MNVLKFGGSSVSSPKNLHQIKHILSAQKTPFVLVVSALSGVTNQLEQLAKNSLNQEFGHGIMALKKRHFDYIKEVFPLKHQTEVLLKCQPLFNELEDLCQSLSIIGELSDLSRDKMLSFGERLSVQIVYLFLLHKGIHIQLKYSPDYIQLTGHQVNFEVTNALLKKGLSPHSNYILPGFIASDENGKLRTLGRGGSDFTAAIIGAALDADQVELWSDIDGIHSANPNVISDSSAIEELSYEEAFELAYYGAKVLYPPAIIPLIKKQIPLWLKNTQHPEQHGSFIHQNGAKGLDKVKGISSIPQMAMLTVSGVHLARTQGQARRVFETLETHQINVVLITQSSSEQSIGIAIQESKLETALLALNKEFETEIKNGQMNPVHSITNQAIIAIVGDGMKDAIGLSGQVFMALGENGVNVSAIAQGASERNISILINQKDEKKALHALHDSLFSNQTKKMHLFIAGVGQVGSSFLKIIEKQANELLVNQQIELRIMGIANSKKYLVSDTALSPSDGLKMNENGIEYQNVDEFLNEMKRLNLSHSVFIDNTASESVSQLYPDILKQSISVVSCNKIAYSQSQNQYELLHQSANNYRAYLKYETTVGAALPIIKTIQDLKLSGDKIQCIEAVVSGSLNFIFNDYSAEKPFVESVKQAKEQGFTEPNPYIDLSGLDVMRKLLILARESGIKAELEDIQFHSFLPESCQNPESEDQLYAHLSQSESFFKKMYEEAQATQSKLKVVAEMNGNELKVSLKSIPPQHPFYELNGKDNVVAIYSRRYPTEPLVIKGAGAGPEITASGVFADLISIANQSK